MIAGSPSAAGIETADLTKSFGPHRALNRVSLSLAAGESVTVFGPNGAGKTTLIRVLTLGLRPSGGTFTLGGLEPRRDGLAIRAMIGVISHQSYLYDDLSPLENLEFYGRLYGVNAPRERGLELLDSFGLAHRAHDAVRTFSRGMQQRVSLARSIVHDPPIVFLDEPFTGLDPHAARMLVRMLQTLREQRRTVFVVTHDLDQGLAISDRWLVLDRGRIVDRGASAEVTPQAFREAYFDRFGRVRDERAMP